MRIFFAIDFPQDIKEILLFKITLFKKIFKDFKWIKMPALHLTIKFIGEVDESFIPDIYKQLKQPLQSIRPFTLRSTRTGFFPDHRRPRVFFLGLMESDALQSCFKTIDENLANIGIAGETRGFHPHITLARIKNNRLTSEDARQLLQETISEMTIDVNEIILMQSELLPSGARYTPVQRFSLRTK